MAMIRFRKKVLGVLVLSLVFVGGLIAYLDHSLRNIDFSGVAVYKEGIGPAFKNTLSEAGN